MNHARNIYALSNIDRCIVCRTQAVGSLDADLQHEVLVVGKRIRFEESDEIEVATTIEFFMLLQAAETIEQRGFVHEPSIGFKFFSEDSLTGYASIDWTHGTVMMKHDGYLGGFAFEVSSRESTTVLSMLAKLEERE